SYRVALPGRDGSADGGEMHPGAARGELDGVAGAVGELGAGGGGVLRPVTLRHPPGGEDPGVAPADHRRLHDLGARLVDVVQAVEAHELDDQVLGGDLGA